MSATPAFALPPHIAVETSADGVAVEALVLAAFGPGRFAKTAERLREGASPAVGFVARDGGVTVGSVRLWPVTVGGRPALFLGPIAVSARNRRAGLGAELVQACLAWVGERGQGILLVGDAPYFGRFGFAAAAGVRLPGPVDSRRVLWRGDAPVSGAVRPA